MSTPLPSSVAVLFSAISLLASSLAQTSEPRVFRNSAGQEIEATFEGIEDGQVTIRRTSDGQSFTLPATSFSIDDQAWFLQQSPTAVPLAPGEWGRLTVELPNPLDYVRVIGIRPNVSDFRTGALEYDLLLPVNAWLFVSVRSGEDPRELVEHLVQYKGERHWKVTEDELNLLLSRDGEPARIVGITPPSNDPMQFVRRVKKDLLADEICLELPTLRILDEIHRLENKVVAYTTDATSYDPESLARLAEAEPKALRISIRPSSMHGITAFKSLEALYLSSYSSRNDLPIDSTRLPNFPDVRDLTLYAVPFNENMGKSLVDHGRLRLFDFTMVSGSKSIDDPPTWEGVDQLAGTLEGLRIDWGLRMNGSELSSLNKLQQLCIGPSSYADSDHGNVSLPDSGEIRILDVLESGLMGSLRNWADAGLLRKVERFGTFRLPDMSKMPNVEFLYMGGNDDSTTRTGVTRLEPLQKLTRLNCLGLLDEDITTLAGLPLASTLEALILRNSTASDLSALSGITSLRRLELHSPQIKVTAIDTGALPKLESLHSYGANELKSVSQVAPHPALTSLIIEDSPPFSGLGEPAENTVLRHIDFEKLPWLSDLSVLEKCTGITQLIIKECDGIEDIRFLERNNELRYLYIYQNKNLDNKGVSDLPR